MNRHLRTPRYARAIVALIVIEIVNEIVDIVWQQFGFQDASLRMQVLKLFTFFGLGLPIALSEWLPDHLRLQLAQRKLADSEQNYKSLFEQNPDGVYVLNLNGNFITANLAFEEITGYSLDEIRALQRFPFASSANRENILMHFHRARQGEYQRYETIILAKDGTPRILDITYFPMYRDQDIVGVFGIAHDITKRKNAEQELRDSQSMFNSFFNNTTDSIVILDAQAKIMRVNRGCEMIYGWRAEELVGQSIDILAPEEARTKPSLAVQSSLENQVVSAEEIIRRTKTGERIDVSVTVSPIRDDSGKVIGLVGVSRDISTQKQIVRELMEAKSRFESVVRQSADAISIVDIEGQLVLVNAAWEQLYGWTSEEVLGKPSPTLLNKHYLGRIFAGQWIKSIERSVLRKDGTPIEVSITASPVYASGPAPVGASFISKDMSERKRNEEIIRRSEKLSVVGELAAGIAHEIRNPLTSVQGFLQLMRTQFKQEYLDILLAEVRRIDEITDELLLLARPQVDTQEEANAAWMVHEVVTLMESQAHMYNVMIHQKLDPGLPSLWCVKSQIKQVFINLIKNSIEAMPKGGNLWIRAKATPAAVEFTVTDDGQGMALDKLHKLGQPFYTTKERGTGLGLMVTYRIIQNHRGSIDVQSDLGRGTTFRISLPRVTASTNEPRL